MKLGKYLKDKLYFILLFIMNYIIILLLLFVFKVAISLIICISFLLILFFITSICIEYFRKKNFYDNFLNNLELLDKKLLILETLEIPDFYDGELLYNALYKINKSTLEELKRYELSTEEFKEYIEMWIHEIKIPISSLSLIAHNHKKEIDKKILVQLNKIDNYIEQILYYVRAENAEKDYLIRENSLSKVISKVALKNKDDLLEKNINFIVDNVKVSVLTDSKWLEFILNQIINNSIKYCDKSKKNKYIKITAIENDKHIILNIYDNGIGIKESDLPRVFDKSFTGANGREFSKATGMGLHIVKSLCERLGHKISIDSIKGDYTLIKIKFYKNDYYSIAK